MRQTLLLWFLATLFSSNVFAARFNYRAVIPGERASGFAGAYTALSDSPEGGHYNPAGLAFLDHDSFSVSANLYRFVRGKRKDALTFAQSTTDLPQDALTSIPQIAAFAQRITLPWEEKTENPRNAVALSIVTADQEFLTGQVDFDVVNGEAAGTRMIRDQTLFVGPSFARRLGNHLSVGATVYYMLQQGERTGFLFEETDEVFAQAFLNATQTVGNLLARVGARYSPYPNLWLGLVYQTPCLRLHSSGVQFYSSGVENKTTDTTETDFYNNSSLAPREELPQQITTGLAYGKPRKWMLAADLLFHLPNTFSSADGPNGISIEQETVVNFSVGGEYYFTPSIPVRAGMFSDFSSAKPIGQGGTNDKIDCLGGTLTFSLERKNTTLTLGGILSFGSGEGVNNLGNQIDVTQNAYSILLAGSYKF